MIQRRNCPCVRQFSFSSSFHCRSIFALRIAARSHTTTTADPAKAQIPDQSLPQSDAEPETSNKSVPPRAAKVVKLMSTNGCHWIDLTSESWSWDRVAENAKSKVAKGLVRNDRSFLLANRSILLENGIGEEVFEKALVDQWLPHTFAAEDRRTACLVLRVVASDEKDWKAVLAEISSEVTTAPDKVGVALSAAQGTSSTTRSVLQGPSFLVTDHITASSRDDASPSASSSSSSSSSQMTEKRPRQRLATMGELTVRLDVFLNVQDRIFVTVHRRPIAFITSLQNGWATKYRHDTMEALLRRLVWHGLWTYRHSVFSLASELDVLEALLFRHEEETDHPLLSPKLLPEQNRPYTNAWTSQQVMQLIQVVNRRASAYTRVLRGFDRAYLKAIHLVMEHEKNVHLLSLSEVRQKRYNEQELKLHIETVILLWEGLREQSQSLLSLHVSVAVSRLEDLLRLLTVFSTVFIPLELVSSFFGMNFVGICHVSGNDQLDLAFAVLVMVATGIGTQRWINKKTSLYAQRW